MKYLVFLLLGAVCIQENSALFGLGKPWARKSLKAKFADLLLNGYFDLPQSTDNKLINKEGYVKIDAETAQLSIPGYLYCRQNDPRVCIIYDKTGRVAGVRTSFLEKDVAKVQGYNYENVNTYKKTNVFNETAYSLDVYFANPETITDAGIGKRSEVADSVWAYIKGQLVQLPKKDPQVKNYNGFQRQACFPMMGQHYFYGMNKTVTDCSQTVPFFGIYHNGEIVGYGIASWGQPSKAPKGRDWYESVPAVAVKLIMPNRPKCVDDLTNRNGLYALHVYFVQTPELIQCLL